MKKICRLCKIDKELSEFYFRNDRNSYRGECKECNNRNSMEYHYINRDIVLDNNKIRYKINRANILIEKQEYYQENIIEIKKYQKEYYENNKYKILEKNLEYRNIHIKEINIQKKSYFQKNKNIRRKYEKNKKNNDVNYKIAKNLRIRINVAIKNNQKSGSAVSDLGCSIKELKTHLESLFQSGMNWENWSRIGWHIDHIIPLSLFDLTDREQFLKACHYTNLQPLWAKDNLRKNDKLDWIKYENLDIDLVE